MIYRHSITALLIFCLAVFCHGEEEQAHADRPAFPAKPKHDLYLAWHNTCLQGDTEAIDTAIKRYETQINSNVHDQLARVYLGSAHALRAKASIWPPTKIKHIRKGQELMDEAVMKAPDNPRVRMIRAIGAYKVPKRFGRRNIAVTDFDKLAPIALDRFTGLKINERQVILYYAWLTFKEEARPDAGKIKKQCHALDPGSKYGKLTSS